MLSPLFDGPAFLFEENWEMTAFHREAAALTAMSEFWRDIEAEAGGLALVPPSGSDLDSLLDWSVEVEADHGKDKLVHHDCMWAGKCDDKLHPGNVVSPESAETVDTVDTVEAPADTVQSVPPGRSLLLVQRCRAPVAAAAPAPPLPPPPPRPDTPLSLDEDEPPQFRHAVDVAGTARRLLDCSTVAADHSYTAPPASSPPPPSASSAAAAAAARARYDHLGVQTPSDSEEELIDVETVGEKSYFQMSASCAPPPRAVALPTNPSMLDRHNLQRTVASAIGTRGRPPHAPPAAPAPRKRLAPPSPESSPPPASRKRARHSLGGGGRRARAAPPSPPQHRVARRAAAADSDSDADGNDVEKRSLHNDMERMRRIGLKNLFDELKVQVPSTRDKARAPKVTILREAALLCRRLQAEERERDALRKQQQRLLARVRKLRMSMAPSYH